MKAEGDPPRPVVGESATKLGVRERDLAADDEGNAQPGQGGMSVPGAIGPNKLHLFRIGEGGFERGPLADRLVLVPDHNDHGTVQPASIIPYQEYKQAIVNTRDQWVSGEDDDDR